jgi:hypothetical protein
MLGYNVPQFLEGVVETCARSHRAIVVHLSAEFDSGMAGGALVVGILGGCLGFAGTSGAPATDWRGWWWGQLLFHSRRPGLCGRRRRQEIVHRRVDLGVRWGHEYAGRVVGRCGRVRIILRLK